MDEIQILLAIAVLYATYRWFSASSGPSGSTNPSSSAAPSASSRYVSLSERIPPNELEQIRSMFPHLSEREAKWVFVYTGRLRSADAVAQSLLDGLYTAVPADFLAAPVVAEHRQTMPGAPTSKSWSDSLIVKFDLVQQAKKQDAEFAAGQSAVGGKGKGTERSLSEEWKGLSLQEKKERMVLDARRRVMEKDNSARLAAHKVQ